MWFWPNSFKNEHYGAGSLTQRLTNYWLLCSHSVERTKKRSRNWCNKRENKTLLKLFRLSYFHPPVTTESPRKDKACIRTLPQLSVLLTFTGNFEFGYGLHFCHVRKSHLWIRVCLSLHAAGLSTQTSGNNKATIGNVWLDNEFLAVSLQRTVGSSANHAMTTSDVSCQYRRRKFVRWFNHWLAI